jgi:hypothetical protein
MATDGPQNLAAFEAAMAVAKTPAELQDLMVRFRAAQGQPAMYDGRVLEVSSVPAGNVVAWGEPKKAPKVDDGLMTRTFVDSKGVSHTVTGYSDTGMDVLEAQIRKNS